MIPGVINQAWNGALGKVERAVIEIIEYDSSNSQKKTGNSCPEEEIELSKKENNLSTKTDHLSKESSKRLMPDKNLLKGTDLMNSNVNQEFVNYVGGRKKAKDKKAKYYASDVEKKAENVLSEEGQLCCLNKDKGQITWTSRKYLVQFNPKDLTLVAKGSSVEEKGGITDNTKSGSKIMYGVLNVNITLTVTLIFNQVNVEDSFLWEKFRLDPSALIEGTIKGIGNGVAEREYTVQTEVEGFLAALRNRNRREIIFSWGEMEYRGILSSVDSTWKMFSVSGKPVHAEVTLQIECTNDGAGKNSLGVWENYYREVFLDADGLNLERGVQNVGNLFQLS